MPVVHPMGARLAVVGVVLVAALSLTAAVVAACGSAATSATLTLDGAAFKPELASTPAARGKGLMDRSTAPKDGMLFVFPTPTSSAFWMKDTRVPLRITFFDTAGRRVDRFLMTPCLRDPCKTYGPDRTYRF